MNRRTPILICLLLFSGNLLAQNSDRAALDVASRTIGVPIALLCVRFIETQLHEIKRIDPPVLLAAIVTLALAASIAALIPARRAASIDPAKALRTE